MPSANPITLVEYRLVIGFPLYRVGNDGSIWSRIINQGSSRRVGERWRRLKGYVNKDGYRVVTLYKHLGSKVYTRKVGTLVLEAFVGPKPEGMQVCHDPDPRGTNNNLANLRWGSAVENAADAARHGRVIRGSMSCWAKLAEDDIPVIRRLAAEKVTRNQIAEQFGVSRNTIEKIISGKRWKHV